MKNTIKLLLPFLVLGLASVYGQATTTTTTTTNMTPGAGNAGMGAGNGSMGGNGKSATAPGAAMRQQMPGMGPKFDTSTLPQNVQTMLQQFTTLRTQLMTDRQALMLKLKTSTATERKQLVSDFIASDKTLLDQQKTLAKQIRDEVRTLRRNQVGTPSGS